MGAWKRIAPPHITNSVRNITSRFGSKKRSNNSKNIFGSTRPTQPGTIASAWLTVNFDNLRWRLSPFYKPSDWDLNLARFTIRSGSYIANLDNTTRPHALFKMLSD